MHLVLIGRGVEHVSIDSGYSSAQKIWLKKYGEPSYTMKEQWGEGFDHLIWDVKLVDTEMKYRLKKY